MIDATIDVPLRCMPTMQTALSVAIARAGDAPVTKSASMMAGRPPYRSSLDRQSTL